MIINPELEEFFLSLPQASFSSEPYVGLSKVEMLKILRPYIIQDFSPGTQALAFDSGSLTICRCLIVSEISNEVGISSSHRGFFVIDNRGLFSTWIMPRWANCYGYYGIEG
jgi:hypothetical protein